MGYQNLLYSLNYLKNIKHINISDNDLYSLGGFQFAQIIKILREAGIISLELSFSDILELDAKQFDEVVNAFKYKKIGSNVGKIEAKNINSLVLHDNKKGYLINYPSLIDRISKLGEATNSLELHFQKANPKLETVTQLITKLKNTTYSLGLHFQEDMPLKVDFVVSIINNFKGKDSEETSLHISPFDIPMDDPKRKVSPYDKIMGAVNATKLKSVSFTSKHHSGMSAKRGSKASPKKNRSNTYSQSEKTRGPSIFRRQRAKTNPKPTNNSAHTALSKS